MCNMSKKSRFKYIGEKRRAYAKSGDPVGSTECANGTRVWICRHIDGTVSLVLNKPEKGTSPKVVFTNNPKVYRRR